MDNTKENVEAVEVPEVVEESTETSVVDPRQQCALEIDKVLKSYGLALIPSLQLIEAEAPYEISEEASDEVEAD